MLPRNRVQLPPTEHGGLEKSVAKRYLGPSCIDGVQCYETPSRVYEGHVLSLVCLITFSVVSIRVHRRFGHEENSRVIDMIKP